MKRFISVLLALLLAASAAIPASAYSLWPNPDSDYPVLEKTVQQAIAEYEAEYGEGVKTRRYYFQMPDGVQGMRSKKDGTSVADSWYNEYSQGAGVYWWGAAEAAPDEFAGYRCAVADAGQHIYYADVPAGVYQIVFNNGVDGGRNNDMPPVSKAAQTINIPCEYADPDEYSSIPEGTDEKSGFNNCIFIINPDRTDGNGISGIRRCGGTWYFYYGNGCYGSYDLTSANFKSIEENCVNPDHFVYGVHVGKVPEGGSGEVIVKSGTYGSCTWTLSYDGVLTVSGSGAIGYDDNPPWGHNIRKVIIEQGVTGIRRETFQNCTGLTSVTFSDSVTAIGPSAFSGCTGLTSIELPDSVKSIGSSAFSGCTGLTSFFIPKYVTEIDREIFTGCSNLKSITVDPGNRAFDSRDGCNAIIDIRSKALLCGCAGTVIPDSVESIGEYAFYECTGLKSVDLPGSLSSIGNNAFSGCTGLNSVNLSGSLTSIGESAFSGCTGLTNIGIPDCVTSIGDYAFSGCTGLTRVSVGKAVTSIGQFAFSYCTRLKAFDIPDSLTSIRYGVFSGCSSLIGIEIPAAVTSIESFAFEGCTGLTSIELPDTVTGIGWLAFSDCPGLRSVTLSQYAVDHYQNIFNSISIETVILNNSVTSIGDSAFFGCTGLTNIGIPDCVTSIGDYAFSGCTGLTSIDLPDAVTSLGTRAFSYCSSLTSIDLPDTVTSIGNCAFEKCTSLKSADLSDSLTVIGDNVFRSCAALTGIDIPDSVTRIGTDAFFCCTGMKSVTIGDSVTHIGNSAFYGCSGMTSIELSDSLQSIEEFAFYGCAGLTHIDLPDTLRSIGESAFKDCTALTGINIPDSVSSIGNSAFYNCTGVRKVMIPDSVTAIGVQAFGYCCDNNTEKRIDGFTVYCFANTAAYDYAWYDYFDIVVLELKSDGTTGIGCYVPGDTDVTVTPLSDMEAAAAAEGLPEGMTAKAVYYIVLTKDGASVQPGTKVKVKIPCDQSGAKVYRKEANGSFTDMNAVYQDGYLVFYTDHFSVYVVAQAKSAVSCLLGDADGDKDVSILDATAIQRNLAGLPTEFFDAKAADADEDGEVMILDATAIQRHLAGLPTNENIGKTIG